jgi:hypothetical protein
MLIGPAVDEAAELYEAADWIGICLSPSTRLILENVRYDIGSNLIVNYNIPQKTGRNLTWAVNWTQFDPSLKCWNILASKANLYARLNQYPKYLKYYNTLQFYSDCIRMQ